MKFNKYLKVITKMIRIHYFIKPKYIIFYDFIVQF